jgi:hypothetical protein
MVMAKSDRHLERAKEFLKISEEEAERAEREKNTKLLQDACAKGWLAAIEATYASLQRKE